jgi:hypothetical protein
MQSLYLEPESTTLEYRSCENGFTPNALIQLHLTQNDVWLCFGAFRNSWTCKKMQNLCSVCRSCKNDFAPNASIVLHWTPNDVWLSFGAFRKPSICKKMENLCFGPECTIWWTEVLGMVSHEMHPFYSIRLKMKFGCVLKHLENLRHVMRCKTFVSGLNALFWCTEVAEMVSHKIHPFYSIGRCLVVFWSFRKPLGSKKMQNFCFGNVCTTLDRSCGNGFTLNASILLHWTPNYVWLSFGAFKKPSACKKMENLCLGPECPNLEFRSCENIFTPNASILLHWTPNGVLLSFGAFRKLSACKKDAKLAFGVPKLQKWFHTKCIHCTPLDLKWCMVIFWSI